jgi:hypothetical protein
MKKLIIASLLSLTIVNYGVAAEKKTICKDVVGKNGQVVKNKDGTTKQQCKTIKVHKKLEGTKVPEKK